MPTILFSAGDPSADAHAAELIQALKRRDPALTFVGLGGPAMQAAGMELLEDLTAAAAIGPFDAVKHIATLVRARRKFAQCLAERKPDLVVLADFGDFHLPFLAPLAGKAQRRVVYFISPQIWAWGKWRLRYVHAHVNRMIALFPFEEAFYQKEGIPVTWVGHPLAERSRPSIDRAAAGQRWSINPVRMTVGLLPGSRLSEIKRHLPLMLKTAEQITQKMPGVQFLVPVAPGLNAGSFSAAQKYPNLQIHLSDGPLADSLQLMDAALVCSGTATLETALARVPMAVVYRTSWPTYLAAKGVLRIPNIALVNIVAEKPIVPEFVQQQANPKALAQAMITLLRDTNIRQEMILSFEKVRRRLGPPGAIERAAEAILKELAVRCE